MVKKQAQRKKQQKPNPIPIFMALFAFLFIAGKSYQLTRSLPKTVGIIILATLPLVIFQKKIFSF
ncbi:MAG: hypothetical protein V3R82_06060 [Candidatus Hydrothermarchaeales archaeon]